MVLNNLYLAQVLAVPRGPADLHDAARQHRDLVKPFAASDRHGRAGALKRHFVISRLQTIARQLEEFGRVFPAQHRVDVVQAVNVKCFGM